MPAPRNPIANCRQILGLDRPGRRGRVPPAHVAAAVGDEHEARARGAVGAPERRGGRDVDGDERLVEDQQVESLAPVILRAAIFCQDDGRLREAALDRRFDHARRAVEQAPAAAQAFAIPNADLGAGSKLRQQAHERPGVERIVLQRLATVTTRAP